MAWDLMKWYGSETPLSDNIQQKSEGLNDQEFLWPAPAFHMCQGE